MTMQAVLFYGPKELKLVSVPIPKPKRGEVLVKVGAALTCGTDFKAYRQGHRVLLGSLPSPFGHELAGTVERVGEGVELFNPGDRVVAANSAPCDRCLFCARGQSQLCENLKLHNGAYAEYNLVPAHIVKHNLYPIGSHLAFQTAALAEPLACAIHAVDVMRIEKGEKVVVLGAGAMSLLLVNALLSREAEILVVGRNPERLKTAAEAGAHKTVSALSSGAAAEILAWTGRPGADCVFEAVGQPETWQQAISLVRKGGKVCLFGGCAMGTRVPVDAHRVHYDQIHLQGVFHHTPKYFAKAVELLSQGRINTGLLITDRIPLSDVPSYFERMHRQSNPKVAVIP